MTPTQASLFASLVPTGVAVHEIFRPPDHPAATLWWAALPEEERLQSLQAVSARRADLAAGRRLAHAALASFGADVPVIGRGIRGEPLWPAGTIGSITHCEGYAAAAAAATTACCAIGIDVEPALSLPAGVLDAIASNSERGHIAALELHDAWTPWDRLLFCIKEACYKAWYPLERSWLDFPDATVHLDPSSETFAVEIGPHVQRSILPARLDGRWAVRGGFIGTALTIDTTAGSC